MLTCSDYLVVWRTDRSRALDPEAEYARWLSAEGSPEAKEERRAAVRDYWRETNQLISMRQEDRWAKKDILE